MENVTFRLEPDEITRVDEQAAIEKRSRSQMLRVLTTEALNARDETYAQSRYGLSADKMRKGAVNADD